MTPRRWFHVLLGAILVPILTLPLVWGVAIAWVRRAADEDGRRWARRLLALAVVDTLLVVAAAAVVARDGEALDPGDEPAADHVVIGVMPDVSFGGPGARLESVFPESPAAEAGLQAGDVVRRVGEEDVADHAALREAIRAREPGVPVALDLERGAARVEVLVTPRRASELPRPRPALLEPAEGTRCFPAPGREGLLQLAFVLATTVVLAAFVRRRGAARGVWAWGVALGASSVGGYAVPAAACVLLGGQAPATLFFSLWGSSLALAAVALAAWRRLEDRPATPPSRGWTSAVALGAWYMLTGAVRLAVVLAVVQQLAPGQEGGAHPLEAVARGLVGVEGPALWLLLVPVVLFAPVGEELAFRGLLQPALGARLRPFAAVAVTALLFAVMHPFYGLKMPFVFLTGAVLGWARVVTGGIRAPIALHVLVNAVSSVGVFLGR